MPASPLERARSLFAEGRFEAGLSAIGASIPDDPLLALSYAEALSETGQQQRAFEIAGRVEAKHAANAAVLATAYRVSAAVRIEQGDRVTGAERLRAAIALAEASGDLPEAARAALRLFSHVHSSSGRETSAEVLAVVKRLVLRSNQPGLLADLHSRVGQAEAQSGRLGAAQRHLNRALELLSTEVHYATLGRTRLALSSTLALLCRNDKATLQAREALKSAEEAGSLALTRLCRANLAQLQFRAGAIAHARTNAGELLNQPGLSSRVRLAVLETYVASLLESGECLDTVPEVREFLETMREQQEPSWIAVEAVPTQARVLCALEGPAEACAALATGRRRSAARGHLNNVCRLALIEAELNALNGNRVHAQDLASEADQLSGETPSIELIGLSERVKALIAVASGARPAARVHFGRSERLFMASGLRTEARRTRRLRIRASSGAIGTEVGASKRGFASVVTLSEGHYLASLAPNPSLLASELINTMGRLRLVDGARVVTGAEISDGAMSPSLRVTCGRENGADVQVELLPRPDYMRQQRLTVLVQTVSRSVRAHGAETERESFAEFFEMEVAPDAKRGIYASASMRRLLTQIRQVARTELTVLILGETGTGKEVVAEEVHVLSAQARGPFVPFNVTAVPRDMLEGQLFGYRRGAFTGAVSDAKGLIRQAEGGTLFIDEIGELSLDLQPKLLRFLESGEIQPLGERPQKVNVRVVAATNARLEELVRAGRFREDLFYRLNVVSLTIPPLRDRREEIPTLVNHFLTVHAKQAGKFIPQLTPHALERLSAYDWPGNVRQLTNELKRIVALSDEDELVDVGHLAPVIRQPVVAPPPAPTDGTSVHVKLDRTLQEMYDDLERAAIARAMEQSRHNQADTARLLGITRKGLYLKRRRLGLDEGHPS